MTKAAAIKSLARWTLLGLTNPRLFFRARTRAAGEIRRIVVVRPDHLGDLLFATPSLDLIRQAFPGAHLTGLIGPWGRPMWQDNPNLDALETVRFPGIAAEREGGALAPYRLLNATAHTIAGGRYDLGIVLRFDHWWGAAMLAAAGVPRRWGYDTPGMKRWLTNAVPYASGRHEVEQNLALVTAAVQGVGAKHSSQAVLEIDRNKGLPALRPPGAEAARDERLAGWTAAPRRAVIHPGTAAANKLWTIAGWAEVARGLLHDGWAVAITGSPGERRLAAAIFDATGPTTSKESLVNIAGRTANLGQLVWVLEQAGIVLGVDSGPLHIADALGKPSVHLYGPSDETIWGPWGDPVKQRAFRAPGTHPTMQLDVGSREIEGGPEMRAITPEMVISEIGLLLSAVSTGTPPAAPSSL